MKVPEHLEHKPIIGVDDYNEIDGQYAPNTDAKALSIGQAQYDEDDISVKIFRHSGEMWSRQSEELPIHRALDLSILIVSTMQSDNHSTSSLNERVISPNRISEIKAYYDNNQEFLQPRLKELKKLLDNLLKYPPAHASL